MSSSTDDQTPPLLQRVISSRMNRFMQTRPDIELSFSTAHESMLGFDHLLRYSCLLQSFQTDPACNPRTGVIPLLCPMTENSGPGVGYTGTTLSKLCPSGPTVMKEHMKTLSNSSQRLMDTLPSSEASLKDSIRFLKASGLDQPYGHSFPSTCLTLHKDMIPYLAKSDASETVRTEYAAHVALQELPNHKPHITEKWNSDNASDIIREYLHTTLAKPPEGEATLAQEATMESDGIEVKMEPED